MQSADPPPPAPSDDPVALTTAPLPAVEVGSNGHRGDDPGSTAYVVAWDAHVRALAGAQARRRRTQNLRLAREVIETGIFALLMFLSVRMVVQNFRVEGLSMDPTYHTGQYVLVNKAIYSRLDLSAIADLVPFWSWDDDGRYLFHGPRRGEVVVFEPPPPNRGDRDFIKRVIGTPGDRIEVRDELVFVNGQQLDEPYLGPVRTACFGQWCDVTLGPDQYFVMGDNRTNSSDSRAWGPVSGDHIIGKALWVYLPVSDFGPAPSGSPGLETAGATSAP
jgi:signal peptidase I